MNINKKTNGRIFVAFFSLLSLLPFAGYAQAGALYGASVEESAIMVRLVNAGAGQAVQLAVGAHELSAPETGTASPYMPISADIYILAFAGKSYEFLPEIGTWYSIVASSGKLTILADKAHTDPARAQLYFYNFSSAGAAELRTADGSVAVIPAVMPFENAQVAVNPLSIALAPFRNGKKIGTDVAVRLERGASFAVFIYDTASGVRSFAVRAVVSGE